MTLKYFALLLSWLLTCSVKANPNIIVIFCDDLGEKSDVSNSHPEVMDQMQKLAAKSRHELGDGARRGKQQREAKTLETSIPMVKQKSRDH